MISSDILLKAKIAELKAEIQVLHSRFDTIEDRITNTQSLIVIGFCIIALVVAFFSRRH